MVRAELRWIPFLSLLKREVHRFVKVVIQTIFAPIVSSSLYLLIFGVSLGKSIQMKGDISYLGFLIPGLLMMGVLNNAFQNSASSIVSSKFSGDLEDYKVTPLSFQQIIWAISIGGLIRGAVVGLMTFIVGQLFYIFLYDQWLAVENPLTLFFFLIIGGLSFAALGLCVAFWAKTVDQLSAFGSFILIPLIYLGGVFFSLETLHPFWQTLSRFNPLLYFINGVRYGILGTADVSIPFAMGVAIFTLIALNIGAAKSLKHGSFTRW